MKPLPVALIATAVAVPAHAGVQRPHFNQQEASVQADLTAPPAALPPLPEPGVFDDAVVSIDTLLTANASLSTSVEGNVVSVDSGIDVPDAILVGPPPIDGDDVPTSHGRSMFDVMFHLDEGHTFNLTGSFSSEQSGSAFHELLLEGPAGSVVQYVDGNGFDPFPTTFDIDGYLDPGTYRLYSSLQAWPDARFSPLGDTATLNYVFAVAPTPTGLLLGLAGLTLAGIARRRRS
jgi:hypothetical protein